MPKPTAKKSSSRRLPATPKDLPGYVIAAGGESLVVKILGKEKPVTVTVFLIRAAAYPDFFIHLQGNLDLQAPPSDERLAELVCAKPAGWADTLHPLSLQKIKGKAIEINFTAALEWVDNQILLQQGNEQIAGKHPEALEAAQKKAASLTSSGSTTSP